MKFLLIFFFFSVSRVCAQCNAGFYDLSFMSLDGRAIDLSSFRGKQLLVMEFDASGPDRDRLLSLDSLYKRRGGSLNVIAIPVLDFGAPIPVDDLRKLLYDTLRISYVMTDVGYAGKSADSLQHCLLKWITHVDSNRHFDDDIVEEGEVFLISTKGNLYAGLKKGIDLNGKAMQEIIDNQPLE